MTISGKLRTMPLEEVLQWLARGRHTGTLVVTDGAVEKSIYLKDGTILSCTSSDPKEFLGHYLVSRGVIDETALADAVAEQDRSGELLGTILVEQGAVSADELEKTLKVKAQESIYGLFSWSGGEFYFIEDVLPEYDIVPISLDVTGLILEGARRVDVWRRILEVVPSTDCVPVAVGDLFDDESDEARRAVLEMVDDDRTVDDICLQTHSVDFFVCEILARKVREGVLKVVRPRVQTVVETPSSMSAAALVKEARQRLSDGAFEQSLRHLRAAANLEPDSREVKEAMRRADIEIKAHLETEGLDPAGVPVLRRELGELRSLSVTPEQGFILSRVDGRIDVRSIVQISPLPEVDALLVVRGLIEAGHLELEFR
jgi:hypothetical protein